MKVDYAIMFSFPFIIFIHLHSSFLRTGSWMGERWCNMLIIFLHNINLVRPCWAFDRQNQNAKWARQIEVLAKWNDVCDSVRGYAFHLRKKHTIDYWKMETGWLVDNVEKGSRVPPTYPVNYKANVVFWQFRKQNAFGDSWVGRHLGGTKCVQRRSWVSIIMGGLWWRRKNGGELVETTDERPSAWD